ncbi:MAG TPA: hypothetical protein VD969_17355 [Symbiobacteriaceae bacterium]|nr:hypothetical protein [Symbiobacteriaceae bacterium]
MPKCLWAAVVVAAVLVAGCGGNASKNQAKQAEKVAVEFYRNWYLDGDIGRAWDLGAPGFWTHTDRDEFVAYKTRQRADINLKLLPVDTELRVQAFDRAGDYLFLIADRQERHLIWVTKVSDGSWKVRRVLDYREGMDIPW